MFDDEEVSFFDDDAEEVARPERTNRKEERRKKKEERKNKKNLKLDKEGSKKNKKAKGIKKVGKTLTKIVVGGLVLYVSFSAITGLFLSRVSNVDGGYTAAPNQSVSTQTLTITANDNSTLLVNEADLGYFYIYDNNGTNELVRTSPQDSYMHYAYDHSVIEDLSINSDDLTPVYSSNLITDIVENGVVDEGTTDGSEYNITINQGTLDTLLSNPTCDDELETYVDSEGNIHDSIDSYLAAMAQQQSNKSR